MASTMKQKEKQDYSLLLPLPATRPAPESRTSKSSPPWCNARVAFCFSSALALATFALLACQCATTTGWLTRPLTPTQDAASSSVILYAASYSGSIFTLNLAKSADANYTLATQQPYDGCQPSPSWLTLDYPNSVLYCTDEGLSSDHGSVSAFDVSEDGGFLSLADRINVVSGPVSAVTYGHRGLSLAVAQYGGSSITWLTTSNHTGLSRPTTKTFNLPEPGPVPSRQEAPHPHQVFLDPTGRFILVPDLGADLVRVFSIGSDGIDLTEVDPLVAAPGSGPRHVDFFEAPDGSIYMYLVTELANTITGYRVSYPTDVAMQFDRFFQIPSHGAGNQVPDGAAAAEITISPDRRFLTVSSRNEKSFAIPDPDSPPEEQDPEPVDSDSLITYAIDPHTGALAFLQKSPAGGLIPRHFAFNKAGTLVAVALQQDGRVAIIERDVISGQMRDIIASVRLKGEVTAVVFYE